LYFFFPFSPPEREAVFLSFPPAFALDSPFSPPFCLGLRGKRGAFLIFPPSSTTPFLLLPFYFFPRGNCPFFLPLSFSFFSPPTFSFFCPFPPLPLVAQIFPYSLPLLFPRTLNLFSLPRRGWEKERKIVLPPPPSWWPAFSPFYRNSQLGWSGRLPPPPSFLCAPAGPSPVFPPLSPVSEQKKEKMPAHFFFLLLFSFPPF